MRTSHLLVSASYHVGYPEYRDADLRSPLMGTVLADSAAVLTGNPVGAFVTHGAAHVSAVVHQEEGGPTKMLPPEVTADYPSHGSGDLAPGLSGLWLLGTAGALTALVHRTSAPPSFLGTSSFTPHSTRAATTHTAERDVAGPEETRRAASRAGVVAAGAAAPGAVPRMDERAARRGLANRS